MPVIPTPEADLIAPLLKQDAIERHYLQPAPEWLEEQALKKLAKENEKAGQPRKHNNFSTASQCQRRSGYEFLGQQPSNEIASREERLKWKRSAAFGDWVHEKWASVLSESGLVALMYLHSTNAVEGEKGYLPPVQAAVEMWLNAATVGHAIHQQMTDQYNLSDGKPDVVCDLPVADSLNSQQRRVVVELKSKDAKYFSRGYQPYLNEALKEHKEQAQLYLWALGLEEARIVVINRQGDWFEPLEYTTYRDEALIQYLLTRLEASTAYAARRELPPKDPESWRRKCRFCQFEQVCDPEAREYRLAEEAVRAETRLRRGQY